MRNSGFPLPRALTGLAVTLALVLLVGAAGRRAAADVLAPFQTTPVITGLNAPTAVRFAPDGRIFVIEQSGLVKVFNGLGDNVPDIAADLSNEVFDNWDRGLLGLAIDPQFPAPGHDYIYVLYTVDAPPGQNPPVYNDACADQNGAGCVTRGRLSRLEIGPNNTMIGQEQILVDDRWCFQYPSHSIGDLHFGPEGALYISSGEGASFTSIDYGQYGNPCNDPVNAGGALRAQNILIHPTPQKWDGALMRVDVSSGTVVPWPTNPTAGGPTTDDDAILAHGFRNPYRFTINPGPGALAGEVWIGDVGMDTWEEINRLQNPNGALLNFGWPCFEGGSGVSTPMPGYQAANLPICQGLYNGTIASNVVPSVFAYNHSQNVVPGEICAINSGSITGVSFYEGSSYPQQYQGALFFEDYTRHCLWAMLPDVPNGAPDPANIQPIIWNAASGAVDIEIGPGGDLFYSDYNSGEIMRLQYFPANRPPLAQLKATPSAGPTPLVVSFDASGSTDPDGDALTYSWDLNGDGVFGDPPGPDPRFATYTYNTPADVPVSVQVTDTHGATSTATVTISVANSPPVPTILTPDPNTTQWIVGETINFSGIANDPDEGVLPASHLQWDLIIHHCFWLSPTSCHTHHVQTFAGVDHGSFIAPDHGYPSYLELDLTATDDGIGWYDKAWGTRRRITFNNAAQAEDLIGFPVLVQLTPTNIDYTKVQSAGQDLRFADNSGALLPYEIESWNPGGTSTVWVRVPQIDASSSTDSILMYYGNAAATDAQNPAGVWDSTYAAVYHMGSPSDSTANANNGTNNGSTAVAGLFGNGSFFDGTDWIQVPDSPSLELNAQATFEAWVKLGPFINDFTRIIDKKTIWNDTAGYDFEYTPRWGYASSLGSGDNFTEADNLNLNGNWHWLVATNTSPSGHIYLDGVDVTTDFSISPLIPGNSVLDIGRSPAQTAYFGGIIDELRIENVARDPAWIAAEYLNMTGGFTTIGAEEGPGGLSVTTAINIQAHTQNLNVSTVPSGLQVSVSGITQTSPFVEPVITNSVSTIGVVSPQQLGPVSEVFNSWSDGGAQSHDVLADTDKFLTATFTGAGATCGNGIVEPGEDCDDQASNGTSGDCCSSTCHFVPTGQTCNDNNACTVGETCNAGVCGGGTTVVCNDGNACTQDSCLPASGCVFDPTPLNGSACNDGQVCTINDVCSGGTCAGAPAPDTDGDGTCNLADNCPYVPNSSQADDGGVDSAIPDGIGDACQCGDLTGNGIVDSNDIAAYRAYLANPSGDPLTGSAALKCAVIGPNSSVCNIVDVAVMSRAMLGLGPGVQQACTAALPH